MFVQVIEAIEKIFGLLSNIGSISNKIKKQKLGGKLIELHESISRVQNNSILIEELLHEILSDEENHAQLYIYATSRFSHLFEEQLKELEHLQYILKDDTTKNIIDIYDETFIKDSDTSASWSERREKWGKESMSWAIDGLIGRKISLIQFLVMLLTKSPSDHGIVIPKSFDLMDFQAFKDEATAHDMFVMGDYQHMLHYRDSFGDFTFFLPTVFMNDATEERDKLRVQNLLILKKRAAVLLRQVIDLRSGERLFNMKSQLAGIIRSNFTIEDIL